MISFKDDKEIPSQRWFASIVVEIAQSSENASDVAIFAKTGPAVNGRTKEDLMWAIRDALWQIAREQA